MKHIEELEKEHLLYAQYIDDFLAAPRTNEQLIDFINNTKNYLSYAAEELHTYNEYMTKFSRFMEKLP